MKNTKIDYIEYEIYENAINIPLFNKIVSFIDETTNKSGKENILLDIEKNCIWFDKVNSTDIQEEYKFEYLGELLERYEERVGNDIKDIRAISLALGYAKDLIEDNMIIGTQLVDFLNKIKNLAENDKYLQGALYLYDNNKYSNYAEGFIKNQDTKTEEIIFILSVLSNNLESVFNKKKEEIIKLIGKEKTISVIGNIGIYVWLIKTLYTLISKSRKKDMSLLKALISVPTGFQKENTKVYKELIENNYSQEEIAYLNYLILYYDTVPKALNLGYSMVEEKIVLNLCEVFINSEISHSEGIYNLLDNLITKYSKFNIKCYGYSGIKDALKIETNIVNPITFIKLYEKLDRNLYSFNILDNKWDIVAEKFDSKQYEELFDTFLLYSSYDKTKINECIEKYNQLTETKYLDSFLKKDYGRDNIFALLINNEILDIKDFFNNVIEKDEKVFNYHLKEYIKGVRNKQSFELLKYLLSLNKYSIKEIDSLGFGFEDLYKNYGHWSYNLDIKRDFLNTDEEIILFNTLENFVFYVKPDRYIDFLDVVLRSNDTEEIIQQEELRKIYELLCDINSKKREDSLLQQKYLTVEEREEIEEQKRKEEELQKQKELIGIEKEVTEKFEIAPKDNFKKLYEFCDNLYYRSREGKACVNIVKEYISKNIFTFTKSIEEIKYLIKILDCCIYQEELTSEEFEDIMCKYLKGEKKEYENYDRAC